MCGKGGVEKDMKRTIPIILSAILSLSLTACGDTDNKSPRTFTNPEPSFAGELIETANFSIWKKEGWRHEIEGFLDGSIYIINSENYRTRLNVATLPLSTVKALSELRETPTEIPENATDREILEIFKSFASEGEHNSEPEIVRVNGIDAVKYTVTISDFSSVEYIIIDDVNYYSVTLYEPGEFLADMEEMLQTFTLNPDATAAFDIYDLLDD
jgi:hypothetical protein